MDSPSSLPRSPARHFLLALAQEGGRPELSALWPEETRVPGMCCSAGWSKNILWFPDLMPTAGASVAPRSPLIPALMLGMVHPLWASVSLGGSDTVAGRGLYRSL